MTQIAIQDTVRMLWMAVKTFRVPFTHPYIQNLTEFDLILLSESHKLDNPEYYRKVVNTFFDEDFDEYANEVENDDELTAEERAQMEEIIRQHKENSEGDSDESIVENYEQSDDFEDMADTFTSEEVDDWEDV